MATYEWLSGSDPSGAFVNNDNFCWVCHREGKVVCCETCPRVYHLKCAQLSSYPPDDWVCIECRRIVQAENVTNLSNALRTLPQQQLIKLLSFAVGRLKGLPGAEPFTDPVDPVKFPNYGDMVAFPMNLLIMEENIRKGVYGSTEAFIADCKWIVHNCILFNGNNSKLTTLSKSLLRMCKWEMEEIETCPDCYGHAYSDDNWFTLACPNPHLLIWARLKGFPFWPAKAMKSRDGNVDCRFFGRHDRAWVPVKECFLYSKEPPCPPKSRSKSLDSCIEELEQHIANLECRFGGYVYAKPRTQYDPRRLFYQLKLCLPGLEQAQKSEQEAVKRKRSSMGAVEEDWTEDHSTEDTPAAVAAAKSAAAADGDDVPDAKKQRVDRETAAAGAETAAAAVDASGEAAVQSAPVAMEIATAAVNSTSSDAAAATTTTSSSIDVTAATETSQSAGTATVTTAAAEGTTATEASAAGSNTTAAAAASATVVTAKSLKQETPLPVTTSSSASTVSAAAAATAVVVDGGVASSSVTATTDTNSANTTTASAKGSLDSNVSKTAAAPLAKPATASLSATPSTPTTLLSKTSAETHTASSSPSAAAAAPTAVLTVPITSPATPAAKAAPVSVKRSPASSALSSPALTHSSSSVKLNTPHTTPMRFLPAVSAASSAAKTTPAAAARQPVSVVAPGPRRSSAASRSSPASSAMRFSTPVHSNGIGSPLHTPSPAARSSQFGASQRVRQLAGAAHMVRGVTTAAAAAAVSGGDTQFAIVGPTTLGPMVVIPGTTAAAAAPHATSRMAGLGGRASLHSLDAATSAPVTEFGQSEMGTVSSELNKQAKNLTDMMRTSLEKVLNDLAMAGSPQATVANLKLQLERLQWKHQVELAEQKKVAESMLAEVRGSMEMAQKRALHKLTAAFAAERLELQRQTEVRVADTKRKQWCAHCGKEAIFYCCWNTSYCDFPCQEAQWPKHMMVCANQQGHQLTADGAASDSSR